MQTTTKSNGVCHLLTAAALLGGLGLAASAAAQASAQPDAIGAYAMTPGRLGASMAALMGLMGIAVGGLALARARRTGNGLGGGIVALAAGLVGSATGGLVVAAAKGGPGTGHGIVGGYVALVLGPIAMVLGGLALARLRRAADRLTS